MDSDLRNYITELQRIQTKQRSAMDGDIMHKDLDEMLFERRQAFENFKNAVSMTPLSLRREFENETETIMKKNSEFLEILHSRREELKQKLNRSAKGRDALKGYGGQNHKKAVYHMKTTG
ncbi:MAG: hypothetical protein HQK66_02915 [Desulfamplus sp.]|nr:hypothetical protein [Desulfamplus sp.]